MMENKELIQLHRQLKKFIHSKVKNSADVEDIAQNVFLKMHLYGSQVRESDKFISWIYQITRNSITDYYREKKKLLEVPLITDREDFNQFNDCVFKCLQQLMYALPSPYREALILTEVDQLPQKLLAEKLGISYSGAKSRVQRARVMLKDKLSEIYHVRTDGYGNVIECQNSGPCGCASEETVRTLNLGAQ